MKAYAFSIILLIFACLLASGAVADKFVILHGSTIKSGFFKLKHNETLSGFLARTGGLPCSDEMLKSYNEGNVVRGVRIVITRDGEQILIKVKDGNSFFKTIFLKEGDVVLLKYDNRISANFHYFNNIFDVKK